MGEQKAILDLNDLHLYGLTSIFISSKLNDYVPIFLSQIIEDAGHNKFTKA